MSGLALTVEFIELVYGIPVNEGTQQRLLELYDQQCKLYALKAAQVDKLSREVKDLSARVDQATACEGKLAEQKRLFSDQAAMGEAVERLRQMGLTKIGSEKTRTVGIQFLEHVLAVYQAMNPLDVSRIVTTRKALATAYLCQNDMQKTKTHLASALSIVDSISPPDGVLEAGLRRIYAFVLLKEKKLGDVLAQVQKGLELIQSTEDPHLLFELGEFYLYQAQAYYAAKQHGKALQAVQNGQVTARKAPEGARILLDLERLETLCNQEMDLSQPT